MKKKNKKAFTAYPEQLIRRCSKDLDELIRKYLCQRIQDDINALSDGDNIDIDTP